MQIAFSQAVEQFQKFLASQGRSPNIIWISRADTLLTGKRLIYVCPPSQTAAAALARQEFDAEMLRGLGVQFQALWYLADVSCCHVWVPRDADEARRMLMPADGSLKMSAAEDSPHVPCKMIRNSLHWAILRRRYKKYLPQLDHIFF